MIRRAARRRRRSDTAAVSPARGQDGPTSVAAWAWSPQTVRDAHLAHIRSINPADLHGTIPVEITPVAARQQIERDVAMWRAVRDAGRFPGCAPADWIEGE